jgi:hypothetical protein
MYTGPHITLARRPPRANTPSHDDSRRIQRAFTPLLTADKRSSSQSGRLPPLIECEGGDLVDHHHSPVSGPARTSVSAVPTAAVRLSNVNVTAFATQVAAQVDNEVHALESQGCASPEDRIRVFQEAARGITEYFTSCAPLLRKVFGEYDRYVAQARDSAGSLRSKVAKQQSEIHTLREELAHVTVAVQEHRRLEDERAAKLTAKLAKYSTPQLLAERLDNVEKQLAHERQLRLQAEDRLLQTAALAGQFQEAQRAMEANFIDRINRRDDDVVRADVARQAADRARFEAMSQSKATAFELQDRIDAVRMELSAATNRGAMLAETVRHLEWKLARSTGRYTELMEAYGVLENRLERLNKPTSAITSRDPTMTPRPNKKDIVQRAPVLGEANTFSSTQSIIDALAEAYSNAALRVEKAESLACATESAVLAKLAELRIRPD